MKRDIMSYIGVLFTILLGTLLHFTYALSGENQLVAVFSAVNESTWEHLKLLFWPTFFWSVAEHFIYGKEYRCFFAAKFAAFCVGALFITVIFYTVSGIVGRDLGFFNVLLFFTAAGVVYLCSDRLLNSDKLRCRSEIVGLAVWLILAVCFALWTFFPPELGIFYSPI